MQLNQFRTVITLVWSLLITPGLFGGVYQMDQTEGRYVRVEMSGMKKTLNLAEIEVFAGGENVALNKKAEMSSQFSHIDKYSAAGGIDMARDKRAGPRTKVETNPWWVVDLGKPYPIDKILIYRASRSLKGATLTVGNNKDGSDAAYTGTVNADANVVGFTSDAKQMKDIGAIWMIGDQLTLGSKDGDPGSSPRSALHKNLSENGYSFCFTGHDTSFADGLPDGPDYRSHSAVSDATIADLAGQLDAYWNQGRLKSCKPEVVCVMLGTNDIHNDEFDEAPERMKALLDKLYGLPGIGNPLVLVGAIPPNQTVERRKTNVNIFNEALENLVADFQLTGKDINFVDHFNALGGERIQPLSAHMLADDASENGLGVDLSARGNQVVGSNWFNAIEVPMITAGTDTEPWVFPKAIAARSVVKFAPSYRQYTLKIPGGGSCTIIPPKRGVIHKSGKKPWFWRNIFYSSNTGQSLITDLKLVDEGYYSVNVYGSVVGHPRGNEKVKAVYDYLTAEYGFAPTFSASAMSRGGFMVLRYATEYPDQIEGILMDNACSDGLSWPAGKPYAGEIEYAPGRTYGGPGSKGSFELYVKEYDELSTLEEATEYLRTNSPIHLLEPLARSGVPILSICGRTDHAVPYEENDARLEEAYRKLGGEIEVIVEDKGHRHGQIDRANKQRFYEFVRENTFRVPSS